MEFSVGQEVCLARELPSLRAGARGAVRGRSASARGLFYSVRFSSTTRVIGASDLTAFVDACPGRAEQENA